MLKKIIIAILAMVLLLGLVACDAKDTQYTLTFVKDGEEVAEKITISNQKIELPEGPAVPGMKFKGWFLDEEGKEELTADYFVKNPATKNTVAYACYEEFTLTFLDASGAEISTMPISNKIIELPKAPEQPGLQFIGWYLDAEALTVKLNNDYFAKNPATKDVVAYACYAEDAVLFEVTPSSIEGCTIMKYIGKVQEIIIPEKMTIVVGGNSKEYKVEAIHNNAFANCKDIVSVTVPATVKSIGNGAFANCTSLKSITVPAETETVGAGIFENATALTDITAPTWVAKLADNKILVNVNLNAGDAIEDEMFKGAKKIEKLTLPAELKTIGKEAFNGAKSLKSINIPAKVTEIAPDAFIYCESLEAITVDTANKNYTSGNSNCIVEKKFDSEKGYIDTLIAGCSKTTIYEGIERIGQYAFVGCTALTSLNVPSTVTDITEGAFLDCPALESIEVSASNAKYASVHDCIIIPHEMRLIQGCKNSVIPEDYTIDGGTKKLATISKYAFATCTGLKEIYIPSSIKELDEGSFENCTALAKVTIENKELKLNGDVFKGCKSFNDITLPMPLLGYFVEKSRAVLKNITLTSGTEIADELFVGCASLATVTLPDTVTEIGVGAFMDCAKLTAVKITKNSAISVIGHNAFDGCDSFERIEIITDKASTADLEASENEVNTFIVPKTITLIGNYAFRGCAIPALEFEKDCALKRIEYKVFADCNELKSVSIPSTITTVDFDAFNGCANLESASVPADFVRALSNAKSANGNPAVKTLEITSHKIVNCYYIREMKNLENLIIGADVEVIDNRSFEGCSALKTITVAADNTVYESATVKGADGKEVGVALIEKATNTLILGTTATVIPETVKTIASYAFALSDIAKIVIPETVELVEEFAFSSCRKLADLTIESSATVIEELAFDGSDAIAKATLPSNAIKFISQASLNTVEITEGDIPAYAFKDCVPLKEVIVSVEVGAVGENAFIGCDNITAITAPASILKGFSELKLEKLGINSFDEKITKEFIDNFKDMTYLYMVASETKYDDKIDDNAFESCQGIIEANVPAWIISKIHTATIEKLTVNCGDTLDGNFNFPALKEVTIGKSITAINSKVFSKSANLTTVTVEEGNAKFIAETGCILDGTTLVLGALNFTLPATVTDIGDYAFAGRTEIAAITLHEGIKSIGNYAFFECNVLVIDSFPVSLETIGESAFYNCKGLTAINLPAIKSIGKYAFGNCEAVTAITLPKEDVLTAIGENAFCGCNNTTVATVPVSAIAYMPKSITTLEIIDGETLAVGSIAGFDKLETLKIGASVKSIDSLVFVASGNEMSFVSALTNITIAAENETYFTDGKFIITKNGGKLVLGCNIPEVIIPEDVTEIAENAFIGCDKITSVSIPASVTKLNKLAFRGCTAIESITVAVENTAYYSANNAVLLKDVAEVTLVLGCKTTVIPEDVIVIGDYAFYGVSGLTEITIPGSVKTIGNYAFANTGVVEIRLPASVTAIGDGAFEGCSKLNKVITLEGSALKTIGSAAFRNCAELKLIVIPGTIENIATDALAKTVKIYWKGTKAEFEASAVATVLSGATVYYYSGSNNPGCWYYKDSGTNVDIW